jgi:hypothetical protein
MEYRVMPVCTICKGWLSLRTIESQQTQENAADDLRLASKTWLANLRTLGLANVRIGKDEPTFASLNGSFDFLPASF